MIIDKLRNEFRDLIQILNNVKAKFDNINVKTKKLKDVYDDLTNTNHDPIYIFGLDFLNFQYKIFHTQYKNHIDMIKLINNRIYGELKKLNSYCLDKDKISEKHLKLSQNGFFLDNFLHSFETNNNIIKNQLDLYVKNIEFFNKNHKMMLNNIYEKICDLYEEIIGNIEFDEEEGASNNPNSPIMGFLNKEENSSNEIVEEHFENELLITTGEGSSSSEKIVIG